MKQNFKFLSVVFILALISFGVSPKTWAEENNSIKKRTLKVQGEGKIKAVPDQAEMEFQVTEDGQNVEEISSLVRAKMEKIFKTIKSFGISDKETQTVNYNVSPKTKYENGESKKVGYTVTNRIKVTIKNIDLTGKILNAVLQDGVSSVDGPTFTISNPSQLKIDALKAAVEDAHAKASAIAETADVELAKVFSISQVSLSMPTPRQRFGYTASEKLSNLEAQVPIATGENEVVAQVEVVYSIK
jgi:hypothetical protein